MSPSAGDRDRLAADLRKADADGSWEDMADRLIDLGWINPGTEEFVESIGLSCCPHTEPAALREHVENEGSCVVCREYIAHTDDGHRLVAWPCPTVRAATLDEERLARALISDIATRYVQPAWVQTGVSEPGYATVREMAAAIAKAYREDTDA